MATTNYSLPTLENTALFDLVTDYNTLSNATDAALAQVAGTIPEETITEMQGQISDLESTTDSQGRQITILESGLQTANSNIDTLQTGLDAATQNINNIKQSFDDYSEFSTKYYQGTNIHSGASGSSLLYVMKNASETIIKIFGSFDINGLQPRVTVPGTTFSDGSTAYGVKTNIKVIDKTIASGYLVQCAAISSSESAYDGSPLYAIGNDGYLYVDGSSTSSSVDPKPTLFLQTPIYIGSPIAIVK